MNNLIEAAAAFDMRRRQQLSACVVRACDAPVARGWFGRTIKRCEAPGVWLPRKSVIELARMQASDQQAYFRRLKFWPEVFVAPDDPRANLPITGPCPACGHPRPPVEDRGVVWSKTT